MHPLDQYEISAQDFKIMLEINPEIPELDYEDIFYNLDILKAIDCSDLIIKNIIVSNPLYLSRDKEDVIALIAKLKSLNFSTLKFLFDANPFLLNKDVYEINEYIKNKLNENKSLEEIVEELELNPYLIDEE